MNNDMTKKRKLVKEIAEKIQPDNVISNAYVVKKLFEKHPEFKNKTNPIEAADYAVNSTSGYDIPRKDGSFGHRCPVLFRTQRNCYVKYNPSCHDKYVCILDKYNEKVIKRI